MKNKVLIGVHHGELKELDWLKKKIEQYSPSKVGIELPEDYLERKNYDVRSFFFGHAVSYLTDIGVVVVPLENPELSDYHRAVRIAKTVRKGEGKKERLELALKRLENKDHSFSLLEVKLRDEHVIKIYRTALKILKKAPTLETVIEISEDTRKKREAYMLEKIVDLYMAIIGDIHAQNLKDCLPEYEYVKSPWCTN